MEQRIYKKKINQVSFLSDVNYFATSLDLNFDIPISKLILIFNAG